MKVIQYIINNTNFLKLIVNNREHEYGITALHQLIVLDYYNLAIKLIENGADQEEPIEIRMDSYGNWKEIYNKSQKSYYSNNNRYAQYILTTPGKILFNQTLHTFIY